MQVDVDTDRGRFNATIIGLFVVSGFALYLIATANPTGSGVDVAGQGFHAQVSTVTGQCEALSAASKLYSPAPVNNALYGSNSFYTETDNIRYTFYSGQLNGLVCSGSIISSYSVTGQPYPITPAMIVTACGAKAPSSCNIYPSSIVKSYNNLYSTYMSQTYFSNNPAVYIFSLSSGISPTVIVAWEAVTT